MVLIIVLDSYGYDISGWLHHYERNPEVSNTYHQLLEGKQVKNFHLQDTLLFHLGHICVPSSERPKLIWEVHYSWVAGHFRVEKTMVALQKYFNWPNLHLDVGRSIKSFTARIISKPSTKNMGLYTPMPTPSRPWESISMDYMPGLPSTKHGNDYVFVVVNRFYRMDIMTTCKKSIITRPLLSYYLSKCGYTFGSLSPLSLIGTKDS